MKHSALILICTLTAAASMRGQEVLTLQYCLERALEHNYDIRIARGEQQVTTNNVSWGNAGFLPSLDATAGYSGALDNRTNRKLRNGTTEHTNNDFDHGADIGLNLTWTVFDGLQMQTNYTRLKEFARMGELQTKLTIDQLISTLTTEYYNYVYQTLIRDNLREALRLSRERLRIAEAQYEIGGGSRLDVLQSRVDYNADSSALVKQQEVLATSAVAIHSLMAADSIKQSLIVADTNILINTSLVEDELLRSMQQTNTALLIARSGTQVSELDYKALRGQNYPYLRLNAGYGYSVHAYNTGTTKWQDNIGLNYGLTVGFNIFDGFNRRRQQQNARIAIDNARLQTDQLILELHADMTTMWLAYKNNLALLHLEQDNLASARENYEAAMYRYRLEELAGIQLREAQYSLFQAQERLLKAQYDTKLCEISLMQISGQATHYMAK